MRSLPNSREDKIGASCRSDTVLLRVLVEALREWNFRSAVDVKSVDDDELDICQLLDATC